MEEGNLTLSTIVHEIRTGVFNVSSFQATLFLLLKRKRGKTIIEALLQDEADVSAQASGSVDSEQIRIRNTHQHIVQLLVNSVPNCDFYDAAKQTVLHYASKRGWLGIVQSLLMKGADPNAKDFVDTTPLMLATIHRHMDVVDLLVRSGADVLCRKIDNYTLLHAASANGWLGFMKILLGSGIDPNAQTIFDVTPLEIAIRRGLKGAVVLLIDCGAIIKKCKDRGVHIIQRAAKMGHIHILQCVIEKFGPQAFNISSLVSAACIHQKIETIEYLVQVLNRMKRNSNTTLNIIVSRYRPNVKLAQLVIERGDYLDFNYFGLVLDDPALKIGILKNKEICTQAIINHFNNKDLRDLYKIPMSAERLPPIEKLTIKSPGIIQDIKQSVQYEIETVGLCNLVRPNVILLSMMSVRSYINYYDSLRKQAQLKRSAAFLSDHQSPKKIQCLDCNAYFHECSVSHVEHKC